MAGQLSFSRLETTRLILRRFTAADLEAHLALRRDPEVLLFQTFGRDYDADQALAYFSEMQQRDPADEQGWFNLCLAERADNRHIGDLGLKREGAACELGITLEPRARGLGYATEALGGVIAWLRRQGVTHFIAEADARNHKSIAIFEQRLGFTFTRDYLDDEVLVRVFESL